MSGRKEKQNREISADAKRVERAFERAVQIRRSEIDQRGRAKSSRGKTVAAVTALALIAWVSLVIVILGVVQ